MNERIKLLAEQAFMAVGTTHDSITHRDQSVLDKNDTVTVYTFTQNTMNKFAELIIRDSIEMFACVDYDESVDMLMDHWDIDPRIFRR